MASLGKLLLLFCALVPRFLFADKILALDPDRQLVAIGMQKPEMVKPEDHVCIHYNDKKIACGEVFKVAGKGVIIFITRGEVAAPKDAVVWVAREQAVAISRNLGVGLNYRFPQVSFQQIFADGWSYGLLCEALLINKDTKPLKGVAALMMLHHYSRGIFKGFWASAGIGLHILNIYPDPKTTIGNGITSMISQVTVGWRFKINDSFNLGVAGGAMYFLDPLVHPYTKWNGFHPSILAEVGYAF